MFCVVIPAYNCESTIVQVLDSVKNQTRFDLIEEIIIVNDGSTDRTDLIIRDYITENTMMNILYLTQDNHGVSYTRNRGIMKATAEWIALLDSDDVWLDTKIEKQYEAMKGIENICFMGSASSLRFLFRKKSGLYKVSAKELCIRSCPVTPSVVFKREIGIKFGLFSEEMNYCEDIHFFQKFLLKDSYYILIDELVKTSINKRFFGESGLTSNLKKMHEGRNSNTRELYKMGLISLKYCILMLILNDFKYMRRKVERMINRNSKKHNEVL